MDHRCLLSLCCFFVVIVQLCGLTLLYVVLLCHQPDVCKHYVGSVYVGRYGGLSESGLCVFRELCQFGFLVAGKIPSVLLQSVVISYVDCGDDG